MEDQSEDPTLTADKEDDGGVAPKKMKTSSLLDEILAEGVMDRTAGVRKSYAKAVPYPHGHIRDLFKKEFISSVKEEIKTQSKVTFKESDLFRVFQSIDLANLVEGEGLANDLPHVMKLRNALYSQEWRTWVERMAGLPPSTLSSEGQQHNIDCACNCHAPGCHLLCHDDVIGTRKISYIIYLTEDDWKPSEGGSLELYGEQSDSKDSSPLPVARLWPEFNSMAFFTVEPGHSFHAVQEVVGERPRLSLQGWYHAATAPQNMEKATLQQLKTMASEPNDESDSDVKLECKFEDEERQKEYSEKDKEFLAKYINPTYLTDDSLVNVQKQFEEDSSVQLRNFFQEKWIPKIEEQKSPIVFDDAYYSSGTSAEWALRGPAHKQRYLEYVPDSEKVEDCAMTGSLLHHIQSEVMSSMPFARFLRRITSLAMPIGVQKSSIRRFRPGLDYTVAHYGLLVDRSVLDATLCFVHDANDNHQAWESGDVGGFECYIAADDDDEKEENDASCPADEYNEDDDTELLNVSASNNTLSLVFRDPGTMRFVKYVSSSAPSPRFDITMEYCIPEDPEEEEELEEEEGDEEQ